MVAQVATTSRSEPVQLSPPVESLLRALLLATTTALLFVAGWFGVRRLGGELHQPLSVSVLVAVAVTLATISSLLRFLSHQVAFPTRWARMRTVVLWSVPVSMAVLCWPSRFQGPAHSHFSASGASCC